jgi:hypothetical protein
MFVGPPPATVVMMPWAAALEHSSVHTMTAANGQADFNGVLCMARSSCLGDPAPAHQAQGMAFPAHRRFLTVPAREIVSALTFPISMPIARTRKSSSSGNLAFDDREERRSVQRLRDRVLYVWQQMTFDVKDRAADVERRVKRQGAKRT